MQKDQTTHFVCPSCGAPVEAERRFDEVYTCPYCGNTAQLASQVAAAGQAAPRSARLANLPSRFDLGLHGTIRGKVPFEVKGMVQLEYGDGYWTEWWLDAGGKEYWLQEDEGIYVLFSSRPIEEPLPPPEALRAGANLEGWNRLPRWFIIEVGRAKLVGYDGELPFDPELGTEFTYVDGLAGGRVMSMEIEADGQTATLSAGEPLEYEDLRIAGEPEGEW